MYKILEELYKLNKAQHKKFPEANPYPPQTEAQVFETKQDLINSL